MRLSESIDRPDLLEHLIRGEQDGPRKRDSQGPRRSLIDDQFQLCGLFERNWVGH